VREILFQNYAYEFYIDFTWQKIFAQAMIHLKYLIGNMARKINVWECDNEGIYILPG
jgi:hypothetical protein